MKNFIEITGSDGREHHINVEHIIRISNNRNNQTRVLLSNDKGVLTKSTPEEILEKIKAG